MARARIHDEIGRVAVSAVLDGAMDRETSAAAVRYLLQRLAERSEGNTVEVRVPPYGAVQCIRGPRHTRGTPPNVVEMTPAVWLALATGARQWSDAYDAGDVRASGLRADLSDHLPVWRATVDR